ncbi:Calpain-1 catalytic subunit, partial [Tolypocladium capitatum]
YAAAAATCRAKVTKIVKECRRVNKKYRDPHFDLESDLKLGRRETLQGLANAAGRPPGSNFRPRSAKRVTEVFDRPQFYIEGPTANDVRQGRDGDCWLMAALCTLSNKMGLIERLCVAHDQDVGVYGFVFHRDGGWISEIVDDFLYLTKPDYDESYTDRVLFTECERLDPEEAYRRVYQANSGALYFAQCEHPQETWLPLLEKCYAKAHGDYAAIEGGFGGEGVEDLTGGVTSEIFTTDILDKDRFWGELLKVNKEFLFGCSTGVWGSSRWGERKGIMELHSYSVQRAVEIDGKRLVRLKNPWGKGEWEGPWSDGSKEWTPEWLEKLGHRFGDDGDFWIAYEDLLRKYQAFERTRLFDTDWSVAQIWTTLSVPWMLNYHDTYFALRVSEPGPVVIVLSQLDERYFRGLEGQYQFKLALRLHKSGHEDYIVRSQAPYRMRRSVNVELELEAGEYDVRVKIDTARDEGVLPVEAVIRNNAKERRDKLTRIGLAYDLAHGKGRVVESPEEAAARAACEEKAKTRQRLEIRKKIQERREEEHYLKRKQFERGQERQRRLQRKRRAKVTEREAKQRAAEGARDAYDATQAERPPQAPDDQTPSGGNEEQVYPSPEADTPGLELEAQEADKIPSANGGNPNEPAPQPDDAATQPFDPAPRLACEFPNPESFDALSDLSDLSDREFDIRIDFHLEQLERELARDQPRDQPPNFLPSPPAAPQDDLDEFERDPWNAVVVVGLRVYHQAADAVRLTVVRPNPYASADDADAADDEGGSKGLDVDDSAKDATLVGGVADRRKSIMGNNSQRPA